MSTLLKLQNIAARCRGSEGKISLSRPDAIDLAEGCGESQAVEQLARMEVIEIPAEAFCALVDRWAEAVANPPPPPAPDPAPFAPATEPPPAEVVAEQAVSNQPSNETKSAKPKK
jgi:hypothetical protein